MQKMSDPRFVGKWAASGAIALPQSDVVGHGLASGVREMQTRLAKGATVISLPGHRGFVSLRSNCARWTHQLGSRVIAGQHRA